MWLVGNRLRRMCVKSHVTQVINPVPGSMDLRHQSRRVKNRAVAAAGAMLVLRDPAEPLCCLVAIQNVLRAQIHVPQCRIVLLRAFDDTYKIK